MWHSALGAKTTDRFSMRMRRTDPLMPMLMPRRMLPEPAAPAGMVARGHRMWHVALGAYGGASFHQFGIGWTGRDRKKERSEHARAVLDAR